MANTTFQSRIKNKRDTAANWEKVATTFQPLDGEIIIVDTASGDVRKKIGKYDTSKGRLLFYNELPFTDEKVQNNVKDLYNVLGEKAEATHDHTGTYSSVQLVRW